MTISGGPVLTAIERASLVDEMLQGVFYPLYGIKTMHKDDAHTRTDEDGDVWCKHCGQPIAIGEGSTENEK